MFSKQKFNKIFQYQTIMGEKENLSSTSATVLSPAASTTPKANMRPLTQAYQTVHAEHEVRVGSTFFEL